MTRNPESPFFSSGEKSRLAELLKKYEQDE